MTTTEVQASVVAIGDVHGCASLLREAIWPHLGSGAELIFLGDLIDRAPEAGGNQQVLELVRELQAHPEAYGLSRVTVLRGNHEQMLLDALEEESAGEATELWQWNGGDTDFLPAAREHQGWFQALPLTAVRGEYLFVHAGVHPGVPLHQQRQDDLLWIRGAFLQRHHGLPYTVIHGHTITADYQIDQKPYRINLDTGAFCSGVLSSLRIEIGARR